MKRLLLAALLPMIWSVPAQAEMKGCYERVYDKKYMRRNKSQQIVKMRVQLGMAKSTQDPVEFQDRLDAVIVKKTTRYKGNVMACAPFGDELKCDIVGDGGTVIVTDRGNNSVRVSNTNFMNFGDDEKNLVVKARGNNVEFRLFRISRGLCP